MTSLLEQLSKYSTLVADTGDIEAIRKFRPRDATTNPSLLLKAARLPDYLQIMDRARVVHAGDQSDQGLDLAVDTLAVEVGAEILEIIPGRVSTEIDARLSFDTPATIERARRIIELYDQKGIHKDRILIKIASTWEGIRAAEQLEKQGIHCNLTLLFGLPQAIACADAGVTLISPFVGRVLDWYKNATGEEYTAQSDPGVLSVRRIYDYYKSNGYETVILAASFRNIGEVCELSGCDLLTISPELLQQLDETEGELVRQLDPARTESIEATPLDEIAFRWAVNQDPMITEKLAEGIRSFSKDLDALKARIASQP